jgi:hypothetical protein
MHDEPQTEVARELQLGVIESAFEQEDGIANTAGSQRRGFVEKGDGESVRHPARAHWHIEAHHDRRHSL